MGGKLYTVTDLVSEHTRKQKKSILIYRYRLRAIPFKRIWEGGKTFFFRPSLPPCIFKKVFPPPCILLNAIALIHCSTHTQVLQNVDNKTPCWNKVSSKIRPHSLYCFLIEPISRTLFRNKTPVLFFQILCYFLMFKLLILALEIDSP